MESGHNILTSLSASGPAHCAYVGVCVREGVRERERKEGDSGMVCMSSRLLYNYGFVCEDSQSSMS